MEKAILDSIYQAIFANDLKHKDIAEMAGITRQAFSRIVNRRCSPKLETVCRIIEAIQERTGGAWTWPKQSK